MEKKKRNRIITWVIVVCVLLAILFPLCFRFIYIDQDVGDFRVRLYFNKCYIIGTTTQGNNQRYLVIPKEIKGRKVVCIGERNFLTGRLLPSISSEMKSDVLERVYFEGITYGLTSTFSGCSNLKKIIFIDDWGTGYDSAGVSMKYYFTPEKYRIKYNPYDTQTFPANILYRFNYEGAENDGYYWIDDYDYGNRIEFVPPEPERDGYTFGGWYKEPECINEWNFETDVLPEKCTEINEDGEEEVIYQETKLYAKWI